jgi:gluconolactonase
VYRIAPETGALQQILPDLQGPNGLAFSPDESVLYVVESRAQPYRKLWAYDVQAQDSGGVKLTNKRLFTEAKDHGAIDGFAVDVQGNLWCGWGSDGSPGADPEKIDGMRVFAPDVTAIAHIHLPERCANVCFGGAKNNRLFMAASHSVYALYTNTRGAV